jgi:hypothetical protein
MKSMIKNTILTSVLCLICRPSFAYTTEEVLTKWKDSAKFTHYGYRLSVEQLYKITPLDQKNPYQYSQKWNLYYTKNSYKWDIASNDQHNMLSFLNGKWRYLNNISQLSGDPYRFGVDSKNGYPEISRGVFDKRTLPQMFQENLRVWPITARQILLAPIRPYGALNLGGELDKNLPDIYADIAQKHPESLHVTTIGKDITLKIDDHYCEYKGSTLPNLVELEQYDNVLVPKKIQVSYMDIFKVSRTEENIIFSNVKKVKNIYIPFQWERRVVMISPTGKNFEMQNLNGKITALDIENADEKNLVVEFPPGTITDGIVVEEKRGVSVTKIATYGGLAFVLTFIAIMFHFIKRRRFL